MRLKDVNEGISEVTTTANVATAETEIFALKAPPRIAYALLNGTPVFMKLHDGGDAEIDKNSEIVFGVRVPGSGSIKEFDRRRYSPWATLSLEDQMKEDNQRTLRVSTENAKGIGIEPDEEVVISVESSDQVDWSNSSLEFTVQRFQL